MVEKKQMQLSVVDDSDRIFGERNNELIAAQEKLGEMEGALQKSVKMCSLPRTALTVRSRCTTLEVT